MDALCINQQDDGEKAHQVSLMTDIYSNTARCLLWLGDFAEADLGEVYFVGDDEAETVRGPWVEISARENVSIKASIPKADVVRAFRLIRRLARLDPKCHFSVKPQGTGASNTLCVRDLQDEFARLSTLLELDWWNRIWTVQEALLPKKAILLCGSLDIDRETMRQAKVTITRHGTADACCDLFFGHHKIFVHTEKYSDNLGILGDRKTISGPADFLVSWYRHRQSSDPRDKVFALFGLTKPVFRDMVDYSLTKREVYTKFTRACILDSGGLSPLARIQEQDRDMDLPSWVPDLEARAADTVSRPSENILLKDEFFRYNASNGKGIAIEPSSKEEELRLRGIQLDVVKAVPGVIPGINRNQRANMALMASRRDLLDREQVSDSTPYPGGGNYGEAFWRTYTNDIRAEHGKLRRALASDEKDWSENWVLRPAGWGGLPDAQFFMTAKGYIGTGPFDTKVGDVAFVLFGGKMPFLLRQMPDEADRPGCYTYVGNAYIHGFMDGEAINDAMEEQVITIL